MQITVLLLPRILQPCADLGGCFCTGKGRCFRGGCGLYAQTRYCGAGQLVRKGVVLCKLYLLADIDYPFSTPLSDKVVLALGVAIVAVNLCALISYICVFFKTAFKKPKV